MTREEAIELLKEYAPRIKPFYEPYRTEYIQAIDMAIEALSADRPTGEWIPVSERLPEKDGRYLVCMSWNYHDMDVYMWADGWNCIRRINGKVDRENEIDGADIIAWMPLPRPYWTKMEG